MRIEQDTLNAWAVLATDTNRYLIRAMDALRVGTLTPEKAQTALEETGTAQQSNNRLFQQLLRAGADDPHPLASVYRERKEAVTLQQMTSPANRRLAALLREAAEAAAEVERERGADAWLSEVLSDYAEGTEEEIHGPASGRDRE